MMTMITVTMGAHAPVTITTGANVQITIDPTDIKVRYDSKTHVFATEAVKAVLSIVMPK